MQPFEKADDEPGGVLTGVLRYYRIYILAVAGLLIGGIWAFVTLPRTEDPEFDVRDVQAVTLWPGVDAAKIEELVTRPLEEAIDELDHIALTWSTSSAGISMILVRIADEADVAEVTAEIEDRIEDAAGDLPAGTHAPELLTFNPAAIPVVLASLQGPEEEEDYHRLEALAEKLKAELTAIDVVSRVEIEGMPERRILVLVDNQRLSQYRIPLTRIRDLLGLENAGIPGGKLDVGRRRYLLDNPNEYGSLEEIEATVIGSFAGSLIRLRDVARVVDGFADRRYAVRTNQRPALLVAVKKKARTNTVAVARKIRDAIERFRDRLDAGYEITVINDRGASVGGMLSNLGWNALGGGVIVILMVTWFLGVRQATVVSISIPLSVLIAFILMRVMAIDIHQVSIFGLVLALGMLVDSALVVVENIALHLEQGEPLFAAVTSGVGEVRTPVGSSVLTTVAAFVPLLFLSGVVGTFIYSLPMTLIFSMIGSLIVALTVVPLLCYALWRTFPPRVLAPEGRPRIVGFYLEIAKAALRNRFFTLSVAVAAFVLSVLAIPYLGLQFFPKAEKKIFLVNLRLPRDANMEATDLITAQVEEILAREAAVHDFTANIGKGSPRIYYNEVRELEIPSYAQMVVNLRKDFDGSVEAWIEGLKTRLRQVSGASVEPKILEQGPVTGAAIQIRVRGDDLATLARLGGEIRARIADVPGVTDLRDTLGEKIPHLVLGLDKQKAALLGVDTFSFASTVNMALNGQPATMYRQEDDEVPVVVRLDPQSIREVSDLNLLYLPSRDGNMVPFAELATVAEQGDFAQIARREGRRMVNVECDVSGRLVADVAADIERRLAEFELPPDYELEIGGESEEREESFAGLGQAMLLALLLIYGILAIQFNSFVQPFVILLTVPFGIIGAVAGLAITGKPFGFMAFIGIVSLIGILINDSIVLTDFANFLQRVQGKRMYESLLLAGERRFRPVILTSVTTIAGMTPLAIWGGTLWSPLACALIFGLAGATVLILVVLPVIYSVLVGQKEKDRSFKVWSRVRQRLLRGESIPGAGRVSR
ncbi:MAG: efflux RND transporter permease subunit [bacterium]|nr:efflux RND transporter permease subunit [bacterium]